jgi:hypothetical protein
MLKLHGAPWQYGYWGQLIVEKTVHLLDHHSCEGIGHALPEAKAQELILLLILNVLVKGCMTAGSCWLKQPNWTTLCQPCGETCLQ